MFEIKHSTNGRESIFSGSISFINVNLRILKHWQKEFNSNLKEKYCIIKYVYLKNKSYNSLYK